MLFVKVRQMNPGVYLCNTILIMKIFCYRHSTINNFGNEIWQSLQELIGDYSYPFKFDTFIARCLGGPFFTEHSVYCSINEVT